eukprot:CAMPEP_0113679856 /NCGR_PEP_ID=MMETSP0038_2-20120614/10916_1 /TAXON_ID=2898 /ORGANISM="Cryptomonas paramecium" /LENGTH=169 /DNA_ID=CAMNT_0000598013 /DNA_START=507 /DNA_END=1016 /DNA_ORIENTATION=- /assembly_acc=CAM_ASM_000170
MTQRFARHVHRLQRRLSRLSSGQSRSLTSAANYKLVVGAAWHGDCTVFARSATAEQGQVQNSEFRTCPWTSWQLTLSQRPWRRPSCRLSLADLDPLHQGNLSQTRPWTSWQLTLSQRPWRRPSCRLSLAVLDPPTAKSPVASSPLDFLAADALPSSVETPFLPPVPGRP